MVDNFTLLILVYYVGDFKIIFCIYLKCVWTTINNTCMNGKLTNLFY